MKLFHTFTSNRPRQKIALSLVFASLVASCASIPPPTGQMAVSKLAVSNATSAGGNEFAPVPLKSAMQKMDQAEQAMTTEDYARARDLAEQAQVDAQLSNATARSAKAKKAVSALQEDNRVLRQEIDRKTP